MDVTEASLRIRSTKTKPILKTKEPVDLPGISVSSSMEEHVKSDKVITNETPAITSSKQRTEDSQSRKARLKKAKKERIKALSSLNRLSLERMNTSELRAGTEQASVILADTSVSEKSSEDSKELLPGKGETLWLEISAVTFTSTQHFCDHLLYH